MSVRDAITVAGLSKTYRITQPGAEPTRITEAVARWVRQPFRRAPVDRFTALQDVSFRVGAGQALGIVGRNGAGKSTLLKILTRVTAPTAGRIEMRGRVGSLLEVGTGFHPELTGRENIFLNGSLLGMRRAEVRRRFDEIVEFSGVSRFLDTPVKRYSSGMYVRLAFAVAAHLDTEILVIDEVLAVGDSEFQARSLAKMRDEAYQGKTVLYVSHQLHTVSALCSSALVLDAGRLLFDGTTADALDVYRRSLTAPVALGSGHAERRYGSGGVRMEEVEVDQGQHRPGDPIEVTVRVGSRTTAEVNTYFVAVEVHNDAGLLITKCDSRLSGMWLDATSPHELRLRLSGPWLAPGSYSLSAYLCNQGVIDAWRPAVVLAVVPDLPYGTLAPDEAIDGALVLSDFDWEVR